MFLESSRPQLVGDQLQAWDNFQKQDAFATLTKQIHGGHYSKAILHLKKIIHKYFWNRPPVFIKYEQEISIKNYL